MVAFWIADPFSRMLNRKSPWKSPGKSPWKSPGKLPGKGPSQGPVAKDTPEQSLGQEAFPAADLAENQGYKVFFR